MNSSYQPLSLEKRIERLGKNMFFGAILITAGYAVSQSETARENLSLAKQVIEDTYNHRPDLSLQHVNELYRR